MIKSTPACYRTGPPAHVAWRAGTTTLCQSWLYPPSQDLWIRLKDKCAWKADWMPDEGSVLDGVLHRRVTEKRTQVLKGTVPRDFRLLFFYHESVSPKPLRIPIGPFRIFSKIRGDIRSSRCTTGVADTGGKWQKSSNWKILISLLGHLWVVELTYI
jgi:hypothetical protein